MNRALRVLACIALTGCHTYQLASLASIQPNNRVRVTARDGRHVELYDVTVANDTLRGLSFTAPRVWSQSRSLDFIAVAVPEVTKVEVRRLHVAGTAVAIAGGAGVLALARYAMNSLVRW